MGRGLLAVLAFGLLMLVSGASSTSEDESFCIHLAASASSSATCASGKKVAAQCAARLVNSACKSILASRPTDLKAWKAAFRAATSAQTCAKPGACAPGCEALAVHAQRAKRDVPELVRQRAGCEPAKPAAAEGVLPPAAAGADIPTSKLCATLAGYNALLPTWFCTTMGAIELVLGVSSNSDFLACPRVNDQVAPTRPLALLKDLRPLPPAVSAARQAAEGPSYYWLYRTLLNFYAYTKCSQTNNNPNAEFVLAAGWKALTIVDLPEPGTPGNGFPPFATVLQNAATKQVAVLVRGTMTAAEWQIDFSYNQTGSLLGLPGKVHWGFGNALAQIWNTSATAIAPTLLKAVAGGAAKQVFVSGHSLGAGVATLLAYKAQELLGPLGLRADTVLFAPPNAGDQQFVQQFNAKVNARRVAYAADIVPLVPCAPAMPTCGASYLDFLGLPTQTDQAGKSTAYAPVAADVAVPASAMPADAGGWADLTGLPLDILAPLKSAAQAGLYIAATHVCSYICWTSKFAGDPVPSYCWLTNTTATPAGASFCLGFPSPDFPFE